MSVFIRRRVFLKTTLFLICVLPFSLFLWRNATTLDSTQFSKKLIYSRLDAICRGETRKWSPYFNDVLQYRRRRYDLYQKSQWNRTGPGEQGKPFKLSEEEYKLASKMLSKTGGSFKVVSDIISLGRALPDPRTERCRQVKYPRFNLTVTVIITYCNDAASLILRTAHSVVNRSPPEYLKEVLLINDHSDHRQPKPQRTRRERQGTNRGLPSPSMSPNEDDVSPVGSPYQNRKNNAAGKSSICFPVSVHANRAEKKLDLFWPAVDADTLVVGADIAAITTAPVDGLRVDDFTDMLKGHKVELGDLLEEQVRVTWPDGIVRVVQTDHRRGVAGARMIGIRNATGDIIVSFDGHIEVFPGWLEPLMARLNENPEALICPILGGISYDTFEVRPGSPFIWDFTWDMMNSARAPLTKLPDQPTEPFRSMASTGGAWAMLRQTFLTLGGYDPGMSAWGGEDFEMALRVWMCTKNGSVEMIPCSHVSHVFRHGERPYHTNNNTDSDYTLRNFQRTAEIWMDEFKPLFYYVQPATKTKNFGDISYMLETKKRLKCRNFKWFLNNIATHKKIFDISDIKHYGQIKSLSDGRCLDMISTKEGYPIGLYKCLDESYQKQYFAYMSPTGHLMLRLKYCIEYGQNPQDVQPKMAICSDKQNQNQNWTYKPDTHEFVHSSGLCLDATDPEGKTSTINYIMVAKCNGTATQKWIWQEKK